MILLAKDSNLLKLPEQLYGTIKRVGILNKEPILYGDVNLLKPNDLYYINGAKQIYRYVKSSIEDDSMTYYFDTIKSTATDNLSVPEDERGHIRNAGYLFNEIIYSGDANLVDNGSLFYHDTLPYISIISNVDGIINVSTKKVRIDGTIGTIINEYRVSPEPHDYSKDYLTFECISSGNDFEFNIPITTSYDGINVTSVSYSLDNGQNWTTCENEGDDIDIHLELSAGDKILLKGIAINYTDEHLNIDSPEEVYSNIHLTGDWSIYGNIMSLFYGDNFVGKTSFPKKDSKDSNYNCAGLFYHNDECNMGDLSNLILPATTLTVSCYYMMFADCPNSIITAPELPATTLASRCYGYMFYDCILLTTAPSLNATTLADYCYLAMFQNCTSLITAPELPATTLAVGCYDSMFYGCTSLITISELPATTLEGGCYSFMFYNCTSLTTAPVLPATTLVKDCYGNMFNGCSSLNYIKALFTTTPSLKYTSNWVSGVASTGTFVKNSAATWNVTGENGIPTGWTVETE